MGIVRVAMGIVPCMSDDDKVRGNGLGEDGTIAAGSEANDKAVAAPAPQVSDLRLNDDVRAYLLGMVTDLEELGGIGVSRIRAIAYGEEATNDELEELGYIFVELLHALVASTDASRPRCSHQDQPGSPGPSLSHSHT